MCFMSCRAHGGICLLSEPLLCICVPSLCGMRSWPQGSYRGVFPVKCNRDWRILQSFVDYGLPFHFGLEAGSKPELLAAIAALQRSPGSLLICNGYKVSSSAGRGGRKPNALSPVIMKSYLQQSEMLAAVYAQRNTA